MSRKKTDPNISTESAFTEKARKRQSRNPLKRGTSEKNMQQIPSPSESTSELPSVARPPTASDPNTTRPATSSSPPIPPIPPIPAGQTSVLREQNSETSQASAEPSAGPSATAQHLNLPNGTGTRHEGLPNEPLTPSDPPPYKSPHVGTSAKGLFAKLTLQMSRDAEGFTVPPSGLDAIAQAEQEAAK